MQRFIIIGVLFFVVLLASAPISAAVPSPDADRLGQSLAAMGLGNTQLELTLRIPIPARTRLNNLQQDELIPGVVLTGTLLRPAEVAVTPRPTIVIATAYRREMCILLGAALVKHGYNVLAIDNRGSASAGGQWTAFDPAEHYDTAYVIDKWIPAQPWSDGKVGMYGVSYMAIIQLLAAGLVETDPATGEPVHLKAIMPCSPMSDPYRTLAAHGGMYEVEFMTVWLVMTDLLSILPPLTFAGVPDAADIEEAVQVWMDHVNNIDDTLNWVFDPTHINYCDYFKQKNAALYFPVKPKKGWRYDNGNPIEEGKRVLPAKLPIFMLGGWYDIFTLGESEVYQYGLARHAPGDKALVMGPWYHITAGMGLGLDGYVNCELAARWFDWKIKGNEDSFMRDFPVLLYVMGEDRWRAEKDWPLPASRIAARTLYLSKARPSQIEGDWFSDLNQGNNYALVENANIGDYADSTHPVLRHAPLCLHGSISRSSARWAAGAADMPFDLALYQKGIDQDVLSPAEDERLDEVGVLTFSTEPLAEDVEITGPLTLTFWARTRFTQPLSQALVDQMVAAIATAMHFTNGNMLLEQINRRDVQWIVEVNDVLTDGRAKNITSGWLAGAHRPYDPRNPTKTDPDYTPFDPFYYVDTFDAVTHPDFNLIQEDTLYRYVVELWPTCNVFKAGHRIRLSISASDFPHILPTLIPSENTIVIDQTHPARLDFTTTTPGDEGRTWKWITSAKGTILEEFSAANTYLLTAKDPVETPEDATADAGPQGADASGSGSSSGRCFIACAGR